MKILFLAGANSIHTVRWVNSLSNRGHEVHLAYIGNHKPQENTIEKKVILHQLPFSGGKAYYLSSRNLQKIYLEIKPDIINAHYASGYGTLARMARLKPLLLSVWGSDVYDFPYQSNFKMNLIKKNINYADHIASTSISMGEQVKKLMDNIEMDISITPFGIDLEEFKPKEKGDCSKKEDQILIGNIKTLNPKYGIKTMIEATGLLMDKLKDYPDFTKKIKVEIYGDGEQREALLLLIKKLSLEEIVTLPGKIPHCDVSKKLLTFDIFCCTSESESFGVSVVEAMAMELPVVATDVSGFKEVMENEVTGYLVTKKKPEEMAQKLFKLVLSEELRLNFGRRGRERVIKLYDWNSNVDKMLVVYEHLTNLVIRNRK